MRQPMVFIIVISFALVSRIGSHAVQHPSFAGTWVQDAPLSPPTGRTPICVASCTITQTDAALAVSEGMHDDSYPLDGKPKITLSTSPNGTARTEIVGTWESAALLITKTMTGANFNHGQPIVTTARLSLSEGHLIIEGTRGNLDGTQDKYRAIYRHPSGAFERR